MSQKIDLRESILSNAERIMQALLDECRSSLQQEDPHKAIHEARKTMKKMRAFTRLLRGEIGEKKYRKTNLFYRDVARQLSEARDVTAMLDTLQSLQETFDMNISGQTLQDIKNHLASRKAAVSRIQVKRDKLLENVLKDLEKGESIHDKWKIKSEDFSAFSKGIERTYSQCQQAMKKAYKKPSSKNFHEWRKRSKYLRYEIDFLQDIWPEPMRALENELHQLTDYLGDEHDLAVLKAYMEGMSYENQEAISSMIATIDQKTEVLRSLAKPLGKKIFYDDPKRFVGRLAYYWKQTLKESDMTEETPLLATT